MRRFLVTIRRITNLKDDIDIWATIESIKKGIDFRGPNVWILAFAIIVASVGLNMNSVAVIIGAMLISPLMGPIMGVGLSVAVNDTALLQRSLKNLAIMVGISLLVSTLYFWLSPLKLDEPTELLARTQPTIFDVFVALVGGLAGIVENARKEKGTVIAGVAIATALMPPLCTAGYGLAGGEWGYFAGAFYLFLINSFFIALATFLMSRFMKFPVVVFPDQAKQRRVNRIIAILSTITVLPSIGIAWALINENSFENGVKKFVNEYSLVLQNTKTQLVKTDIRHAYHIFDSCTLYIPVIGEPLGSAQLQQMHERMQQAGIGRTRLQVTHSPAFNTAGDGTAAAILKSVYEHSETSLKNKDARIAQLEQELSTLRSGDIPYAQIAREMAVTFPSITRVVLARGMQVEVHRQQTEETVSLIAYGLSRTESQTLQRLEEWLKVRLQVKNVQVIPVSE